MGSEHGKVVAFTTSLHPNTDVDAEKYAAMTIQRQRQWSREMMFPVGYPPDLSPLH